MYTLALNSLTHSLPGCVILIYGGTRGTLSTFNSLTAKREVINSLVSPLLSRPDSIIQVIVVFVSLLTCLSKPHPITKHTSNSYTVV